MGLDKESRKQEQILKMYQDQEAKKFKIFEEEKPDEALEKMRELTKKPDNYEIYNKSLQKKISSRNFATSVEDKGNFMTQTLALNDSMNKKSILASVSVINNPEEDDNLGNILEEKTIFNQQI